jgi:hypothetical protein
LQGGFATTVFALVVVVGGLPEAESVQKAAEQLGEPWMCRFSQHR